MTDREPTVLGPFLIVSIGKYTKDAIRYPVLGPFGD